ncbi:hypothetical protein ACIBED_03050 [Rhodococcus coprophilus]|uniref:Serine/threonine protein kinase n=1 Tax=Rhodococcus coprophilus TaxID=38310 RepID=A0A2X4U3E1_9NOCA|nr:hypothetical protein [Rhodococcus coprophilus]MBM7461010.1 hypothetical protein [Rhodococcus coprophilus]SQI28812.1 Uncharacterised protein [Rhodococcus coprophilus]
MSSPSQSLTLWAGAWLSGRAAPDDVIDALHEWAPMHLVAAGEPDAKHRAGLTGQDPEDGAAGLLTVIRRADPVGSAGIRLLLPSPGDVRGLPIGLPFSAAATTAGEGVLVGVPGTPGLGLVPTVEGPDVLRWNVFAVPQVPEPTDLPGLGEAEFTMREAVRDAATTLAGIHTVGDDGRGTDPRAEIATELAQIARHRYPDTIPQRAVRILDSADQVEAILTVAGRGGGLRAASATATAAREDALRPLWTAVRNARVGAINAALHATMRG